MPFYTVEQNGVPGIRLVEADKPAQALNHVIEDTFTVKKVDGAELLAAAKLAEPEVAGAKKAEEPAPEGGDSEPEPTSDDTDAGDGQAGEKRLYERMQEASAASAE